MTLDIRWSPSTPSTNRLALDAISARPWTVWTTDHQTAGRGRLTSSGRRAWHDSPGECLLMSVIVEPKVPVSAAPRLTLVAGIAAAEAVSEVAGVNVRLKWPNDLVLDGGKLGGILVESTQTSRHLRAVVGMGINVNNDPAAIDGVLGRPVSSLRQTTGHRWDRLGLLTAIVGAMRSTVTLFERSGGELGPLLERWEARSAVDGARVAVGDRPGTALGVGPGGGLRVRWDDGSEDEIESGVVTWA